MESTIYWVYILENAAGKFYVGSSDDPERRETEHNDTSYGATTFMRRGITDAYEDPVAALNNQFEGRWVAAFAEVEDSHFVVVVQRRYTPALPGGVAMAVALVALVLVFAGVASYGLR